MTELRAEAYPLVDDYAGADVVIVYTCGFIKAAIEESLEAIDEALQAYSQLIVTGCLGQRAALIRQTHPDVIAISGPADYQAVTDAVD